MAKSIWNPAARVKALIFPCFVNFACPFETLLTNGASPKFEREFLYPQPLLAKFIGFIHRTSTIRYQMNNAVGVRIDWEIDWQM